jgi:hypothetical protein
MRCYKYTPALNLSQLRSALMLASCLALKPPAPFWVHAVLIVQILLGLSLD